MQFKPTDILFLKLLERVQLPADAEKRPQKNQIPALAALDIPRIDAENRELLFEAAKDYIEKTKIGEFEQYHRPFTRQIKSDFRTLFPILIPFFDHSDQAEAGAIRTATSMRIITLILFTLYIAGIGYVISLLASGADDLTSSKLEKAWPIFLPLVIPVITGLVRASRLDNVRRASSDFGSQFNANLNLINNKASYALERVSDDAPASEGCDERAKKWTTVALWLFSLHGLYDRYVTTISWRVQTSFVYVTWLFRSVKWAILVVFGFLLADQVSALSPSAPAIAAVVLFVLALFVWDIFPGRGASNNLFAESFIGSVAGRTPEEISENHFITKAASLVKKLRELYYNATKD